MKKGKFFSKKKLPSALRKTKTTTDTCENLAEVTCNGNTNYNQFAMHILVLMSFVDKISENGLDLTTVVELSEELFKDSLNFKDFHFVEYTHKNEFFLVYKIIGKARDTFENYDGLRFDLVPDTAFLVNTFNTFFSMGYHSKSIFQCSTHLFGVVTNENKYYLFDPNVEGTFTADGKSTCKFFKCHSIDKLADCIIESLKQKGQQVQDVPCTLTGIHTLQPVRLLRINDKVHPLYVCDESKNEHNDSSTTAEPHVLTSETYNTRSRVHKAKNVQQNDDEEFQKYMQNLREQLKKIEEDFHYYAIHDKSKLRDLTRQYLNLKNKIKSGEQKLEDRKGEYEAQMKKDVADKKNQEYLKKKQQLMAQNRKRKNEEDKDVCRKKDREYRASKRIKMTEEQRQECLEKKRQFMNNFRINMTEKQRQEYLEKNRQFVENFRINMTEEQRQEYLEKNRQAMENFRINMTEDQREKYLAAQRQFVENLRSQMSDEQRENYLKNQRQLMKDLRFNMSDTEIEEYLLKQRLLMENLRINMTAEEREEYLKRQKEIMQTLRVNMSELEMEEYLEKKRNQMAEKRKTMTAAEKKAEKLKSKERYKLHQQDISEKNQLIAEIRKDLGFGGKKDDVIQKLAESLGGTAESHVEAEKLINLNLRHRQLLLNLVSRSTASFVNTLKRIEEKCKGKESMEDKLEAMLGSNLHTNLTESFFVDSTYKQMPMAVYVISEDGKIMNTFEPVTSKEDEVNFLKWHCNEMCAVDKNMVQTRFQRIIEGIIGATSETLITFFENIDECPRQDFWKKMITDGKDAPEYTAREPMGHPHACYIHQPDDYGCISILLFFRCLAPHYPSIRNIVSSLYRLKKKIKEIKSIDTSIEELRVEELNEVSKKVKEKANMGFVCSDEWQYAHEDEIIEKFNAAYVALKQKTLDVPNVVCASCERLSFATKSRFIGDFQPAEKYRGAVRVWDDLLDYHTDNNNDYKFICNYCYEKFQKGEYPARCILNYQQVRPPPACIQRLNDYEKLLIQRAKAFQVVTRMGSVSGKNRPRKDMISKVVGRTFHLPLPIEKTLEKLPTPQQAIMPNQDVYILLRGQPTKQRRMWQSFVNINHVYEALEWLKTNNILYKDIVLPSSAANLLDELDDIDVQFNLEENPNAPVEEAMITQKDVNDSFYEHVTLHSIGEQRPNENPTTIYQMKKVSADPIDSRATDLDLKCFPDLFCYGENGAHTERQQPLTFAEFIKNKLMSVHSQFRLNIQYIFFLLSMVNLRQIYSGIYTTLNTAPATKNITVKHLKTTLENKEFNINACNIFSRLRNTLSFWSKPRNNVNCMVKYYGPATWFLTISPSEYLWKDLENYLREVNPERGQNLSASALIAMDPISTSRFIDNKFHAMMKFISSPNGPLGKVSHYAWRREYQARGLQHFHILIWVEGAPTLGVSTDDEVKDFISKYVTCRIPDSVNFPTLNARVLKHQQHYHNSYCQRSKKTKHGKFVKVCRFGFSRPISEHFVLRDVATSIHGRRKLKLKTRLYDLQRTAEEIDVNDYNPAILMAWQGNMDLQFIGEKSCALTSYITKYTTKAEKSFAGDGFADIPACKPLFTKLWMMGQRLLSNRECGALEAADTLLGIPLFGTDDNTTIQWLDVRMARNRKIQPWNKVQEMNEDDTNIFLPSLIDTHYPKRPDPLVDVCLYDFASRYDIVDDKPKSGTFYVYGKKFVKPRQKKCLINHYNYNMEKNREQYFYSLLLLFKPFRHEDELLGSFKTYAEAFDSCKDTLTKAFEYHEKLQELRTARDLVNEQVSELEKGDKEEEDASNSQNIVHCDPVNDNGPDDRPCLQVDDVSVATIDSMIAGLNVDQLRIFNNIKDTLTNQANNVPNTGVIRSFISGVGGVGKSYVIKLIRSWVKAHLNSDVIVAAPTGIAAFNVQGLTIHSLLKLPVEHGSTPKYEVLSDLNLQKLRNFFRGVVLIIIDEISMVSNLTLLYIHLRLQEIFDTFNVEDGWFGKQNLLFFGDLLQLPPVNSDPAFMTLKGEDIAKRHSSLVVDTNLWADLFSYDELTINVRQKSDTAFADMLSRIRLGYVTKNDEQSLRSRQMTFVASKDYNGYLRQVVEKYQSLPPNCLCLMPTKQQCRDLNGAMLSLLPGPLVLIETKDKVEGKTNVQRKEAAKYLKKISEDSSNTAGLEEVLEIKEGCKVMLRRNIDSARGLVNGAIGVVSDIVYDLAGTEVSTIKIRFTNEDYVLERDEAKFEVFTNVYVVRRQFPITLAYSITIHKSQSLSVDHALIDIGQSVFSKGQTYVALSRLTSLDGLNIINFEGRNVSADTNAIREYNRLRSIYRPDLPQIPFVQNKSATTTDTVWWDKKKVADPAPPVAPQIISFLPGFLNQSGTNCFANSALQCLLHFRSVTSSIMTAPHTNLQDLTSLYNDPTTTTLKSDKIIQDVQLALGQQQDAAEFIHLLSEKYTFLANNYSFNLKETLKCRNGVCRYQKVDLSEEYQFRLSIPTSPKTKAVTIHNLMDYSKAFQKIPDGKCPLCQEFTLSNCFEILNSNKIIILTLNVFTNRDARDRLVPSYKFPLKINTLPTSILSICGSQYSLKCAVFHFGESPQSGHYIAYVKLEDGWYVANDTTISKTQWARGSKNAYILFYERK